MLRRRGAGDDGTEDARPDRDDGSKYASKTSPLLLALVATALAAPIAYVLVGGAGADAAAGGHGHGHGASGASGHRDHITLPNSAAGQLRGLGAGSRAAKAGAAGASCSDGASPGAAAPWPLIDDALNAEGMRLELVTTRPLSYTFGMTFCDAVEDGTERMRSMGLFSRGAAVRAGLPAFSRAMQGVEGAATGGGEHVTCGTAKFFLVDQETEYSDKIIDYVTDHEGAVIELFTGLLSASACKPLANGWSYHCAGGLTPEFIAGRNLKVLDYGSNAGFFGQMAARYGYDTIVVEPQPHCVQYIRAATALNGVNGKVTLHHAFLSAGGRTAAGETEMPLPRRTGCMGTWPLPQESKVRAFYDAMPGGNETIMVPVVDPASLVGENDLVVLAKVDVEGHEVDVLHALEPHLKAGRILNLMVEFNKRSYVPEQDIEDAIKKGFKESFPVFTKLLEYMRDMGYSAMSAQYSRTLAWGTSDTIPKDAASIKAFVEDGWMTTNVWFALRRI